MKKFKRLLLGLGILSTIGIGNAYALNLPNPLIKVADQLQHQLSFIDKYITSTVSHKLDSLSESLGGDVQALINQSVSALGLPDLIEVRKKVEEIANEDNYAINSVDKASNEIDRQVTRAVSGTTLSKEGQKSTKQQIENTQTSQHAVEALSEAAQNEVVTQNVMKRIAQQNNQIAGILGAMRTDELKLKQSQDLANLNLTNISRSVDGQNQARQKEVVGQGFSNLRTASQAQLF